MSCCNHCIDAERLFTEKAARRELRRYRRGRIHPTGRALLRLLSGSDLRGGTLLDIGGGVGILQHELLGQGLLASAVHVDASAAYLRASEAEADRRGHADHVEYRHGDFVELSRELPDADVVTLDRVVCCYPDMPALIAASASKARRFYGLSFPRRRWVTRAGVALGNLWCRMRGSDFRAFVHSPAEIRAEILRHGLRRMEATRTPIWEVEIYRRS
jgi:SAM-dependent methyltransferase